MKKQTKIRLVIFAALLMMVLSVAAVSVDNALAAKTNIVRLTVINESQFAFELYLYGPKDYTIKVPANSTDKIVVDRNLYKYYMEVCNYSKTGDLDMTIYQTLHVPPCGGRGVTNPKQHHIDVAQLVKPVRITVRNKTGEDVGVYIRTQTDHHFLNFKAGEIATVVLRKDKDMPEIQYVYSFQACGGQLISGYFTPRVTPPLDLKCP